MPVPAVQPARSPTLSPSRVLSPSPHSTPKTNGTRTHTPATDVRPVRQDKKRMSLSFFGIGAPTTEGASQPSIKDASPPEPDNIDATSTTATSRSHSKDRSNQNRLSRGPPVPTSPVLEALPHFQAPPPSSSPRNLSKVRSRASSRGQSVDGRPTTGKSEKSEGGKSRSSNSMKKRLSNLYLGKKSSKGSVRGRVGATLTEE